MFDTVLGYIISFVSLVGSAIAIFINITRNSSEIDNKDADTIKSLFQTIKEQKEHYDKLEQDFEEYKKSMNSRLSSLQTDYTHVRVWAEKLAKQLRDNNIQPESY